MSATSDEVVRIARLAQLDLDPETIPRLSSQLRAILDYVAAVNELAIDPGDPDAEPAEQHQPLRPDDAVSPPPREPSLANAPDVAGGYFRVPRVLSE